MDTTPFHLILFALDIAVLGGLFLWFRFRQNSRSKHSEVYHFEKSLYVPSAKASRRPSSLWDVAGVLLFGGFWLGCLAVLSRLIVTNFVQDRIYHFNVGQCIAEGIAIHGTLFLLVAAFLLHRNRRTVLALFACCSAILLAGLSFNMLYWEPYHVQVAHYEIKTSKLTKPLRIVFVSDMQTDRIGHHEINTLRKIKQQKADLIILGGDYLQTFGSTWEKQLPEKFRQLFLDHPLTAPYGVYAVTGNNHDAEVSDAELFRETGVIFYLDSVVLENLGADKGLEPIDVVLLGLGDSCGWFGDAADVALRNTEGEYTDNFLVMAGHYPNYAIDGSTNPETKKSRSGYRQAERAPDLMLAGHTHGGQVVIPFYGPVPFGGNKYAQQMPRTMRGGFFTYPNGGHLLVTRGSGLERGWAPRIRFFCPAEISVINIVPE